MSRAQRAQRHRLAVEVGAHLPYYPVGMTLARLAAEVLGDACEQNQKRVQHALEYLWKHWAIFVHEAPVYSGHRGQADAWEYWLGEPKARAAIEELQVRELSTT